MNREEIETLGRYNAERGREPMDLTPGEDQKRSDGPTCGMCHPCRLEDIDPNTTVYRCPEHQQMWDERIAPLLANIIQPLPWQAA